MQEFIGLFFTLMIIAMLIYSLYQLFLWIQRKRSAKYMTADELKEYGRHIQLLDVREKAEYDAKHILGARNVPYTYLKQGLVDVRYDQPICLYDDYVFVSGRAAALLKKVGHKDIYILKGGLEEWTGKVKISKKQ